MEVSHHTVTSFKMSTKEYVDFECATSVQGDSLNGFLMQGLNRTTRLDAVLFRSRKNPTAPAGGYRDDFANASARETGAMRFLWWQNDQIDGNPVECQVA